MKYLLFLLVICSCQGGVLVNSHRVAHLDVAGTTPTATPEPPEGPTPDSITVDSTGSTITITWPESVTCDTLNSLGGITLYGTGSTISYHLEGCDGSTDISYSLTQATQPFETITADLGPFWTGSSGVNPSITAFEVVNNSMIDLVGPNTISRVVDEAGTTLTFTFNEPVNHSTRHLFTLNSNIGVITPTYVDGDGTNIITFSLDTTVLSNDSLTITFDGGEFSDLALTLNDSGAGLNQPVTNNSTQ